MLYQCMQGAVTEKGPVQNLLEFAADPWHNTIFDELQNFRLEQVTDLS